MIYLILFFIVYLVLGILCVIVFIYSFYTAYAMVKGAPFVPTDHEDVKKMIELSGLKKGEKMVDLGSGDGRIIIQAAKTGADCVGIEINPLLYFWSLFRIKINHLKNVTVCRNDLWKINLVDVDVLTLFFIHTKMDRLHFKISKEMKPGSRIITYAFKFPDWKYQTKNDKIYLYIV